jgi:hypothetical protein
MLFTRCQKQICGKLIFTVLLIIGEHQKIGMKIKVALKTNVDPIA